MWVWASSQYGCAAGARGVQEVVIELGDRSVGFAEIEAGAVADVGRLGALRAMRGVGHECEYIHLLCR